MDSEGLTSDPHYRVTAAPPVADSIIYRQRKRPDHCRARKSARDVELRGFEPLTPTLPVWCATNCAIAPDCCAHRSYTTTSVAQNRRSRAFPAASGPIMGAPLSSRAAPGPVSGANTQPMHATPRMTPLTRNASPYDVYCAISPTSSEPPDRSEVAIIWNVAIAVPPRDLLPTTSATRPAAGETNIPVAAPAT